MDGGFLLMKCVKKQMNGKADLFKNHGLTFINLLIYKLLMNVKRISLLLLMAVNPLVGGGYYFSNGLLLHTFEVAFRAGLVSNFATRTAAKVVYLKYLLSGRLHTIVRPHPKFWHCISPNTDDWFLKCSSYMHEPSIVRNNESGLFYKVGAFIEFEFATSRVNLDWVDSSNLVTIFIVFGATQ